MGSEVTLIQNVTVVQQSEYEAYGQVINGV